MKYKTKAKLIKGIARVIVAGIMLLIILSIFANMTACAERCM